jgi:hypothetical protein
MLSFGVLLLAAASALPIHVVKGIVTEAKTHTPVRGASVALPNGKRIASTGKAGQFRAEIPVGPWPAALTIASPGLAERSVELPHAAADVDLKEIALTAAARIHAILPPPFAAENLRWSLFRVVAGKIAGKRAEGQFAHARADVMIDNLDADRYVLVIAGDGPLQQIATNASPKPGETIELPVNITPDVLRLSVVSGEAPVAGARIRFAPRDFAWSGIVTCDEKGATATELWQEGDFWASLLEQDHTAFGSSASLHTETGTISWTFEVPSHHVKGRVVDSATHNPIPDAVVKVSGTAPAGGGLEGIQVHTDADGRFDLPAIKEGEHRIRTYKKGYRYDREQNIKIEKDDGDWEGEIALDSLEGQPSVIVLDEAGTPLPAVEMFLASADGMVLLEHTDTSGRVTIPPQRDGIVFAVPAEGSFGFTRISADQTTDVTLRVPRPIGSIDVLSQSTAGKPISNVFFQMRINGTWIPFQVFSRFVSLHALPFRTDETGRAHLALLPGGLYELWPINSHDDISSLMAGAPIQAPATVVVDDKPQIVTLTFRKKPAS